MMHGFTKCGCFVLINKFFFDVNPPYIQSDFMVNPGPMLEFSTKKLLFTF